MDEVSIGQPYGLRLGPVERSSDGQPWSARVDLRLRDLDASVKVAAHYSTYFDDLVSFFRSLESDWRGWQGRRRYESLEGELALSAEHDGHVRILVGLAQTTDLDGWKLSGEFQLDPGEELSRAATDVARILSSGVPEASQ